MEDNIKKFIGSGLIFPIQLGPGGVPLVDTGFNLIRSNIQILLSWPSLQRFYLAEYGSRIEELLEEPNDLILTQVIRRYTIDAISQWEKRVSLISADIMIPTGGTTIQVGLHYKIINTNLEDSFVFPFYEKLIY